MTIAPAEAAATGWDVATALGTLGAVGVALLAIAIERWTYWRDKRDRDAAQARLVVEEGAGMASGEVIKVRLVNHSDRPIIGLEVDEVTWGAEFPVPATWRVPPTIFGARSSTSVVGPGDKFEVPVEFVDEHGKRQTLNVPGTYTVRYSFHDANGLTWEKQTNAQPRRVKKDGRWFSRS